MLRRILWAILGLFLLLLVLVAGLLGYAQTQGGQDRIAALLTAVLSTPEQSFQIEGLRGTVPFDLRLASLRLTDRQGSWLEAEDLRLAIRARDLLQGAVTLREVGAGRVMVHRLPPPGAEEPPAPSGEPFRLPELPELPETLPAVAVERLHVDRLELAQPVLGEPAAFSLEGRAVTGADRRTAELNLALRRIDAPTAAADIKARLDLQGQRLDLNLAASETGGLLARTTDRPGAGDLRLTLSGEGPLSAWRGRLEAEAQGLAQADVDLDLAYAGEKRLGVAGGVVLAPGLLPPELARPLGQRLELALDAHAPSPQQVSVDRLTLRNDLASLTGTAVADLSADTITARLDLEAPDLTPLSELAARPVAGSVRATLTAEGATSQPRLRLALDGRQIAVTPAAMEALSLTADVQFLEPLGRGEPALQATVRGRADALTVDGRDLGPGGRVDLDLAASLPASGRAGIERLELRSPLAVLTAAGGVDRASLAGEGRIDLVVTDLAAVAAVLAPDVSTGEIGGGLGLGATIESAAEGRTIDVTLDGGSHDLRVPDRLLPLIGTTPVLAGELTVRPGESVVTRWLTLAGQAFRLDADPRLGLADQALGGGLRLRVPDLALLEPLAGQPLAGSLDVTATLAGSIPAPAVELEATSRRLSVAGQDFTRLDLAASMAGEAGSPAGTAKLEAERAGAVATLGTRYALAGQKLSLTELVLEAPATRLEGALEVALDGPSASGNMAGQARDLGALQPFTQQALAGAVGLDLRLSTPDGRQGADLEIATDGVTGSFGRLGATRLQAELRDALGALGVDASLAAQDFTAPGVMVDRTTLVAQGPLSALQVRLATAGEQAGRRFDLSAATTVDAASTTKTIRLAELEAGLAGERIELVQPATLQLGPDGSMALDRLLLALASGRLALSGGLDRGSVRANAELDGLDLARLQAFGAPPLAGRADAQASLSGSMQAPEAQTRVEVRGLALDPARPLKPNLQLDARLARGQLAADLAVTGLGDRALTGNVALPMVLALQPFEAAIADDAPLRGRIEGAIDLARLMALAPAEGVQLIGELQVGLGLGGTKAQPAIDGAVTLAGGSLQALSSGIDLVDIALRLEGRGREIVLTSLGAAGRTGGALRASGRAGLLPDGGVRYDAAVDLDRLRVLNNELGTVVLSSDVDASGDLRGARVGGTLTLDGADIAIPDGGGPSVPVIDVQEVNATPGMSSGFPEPAAGPPFDLVLDLRIEAPARLFVRGRGLDSEWGGTLSVRGPATAPEIIGELEFRRGFLDLLEKRFQIRRGVISFVGSQPPLPMIDLEAAASSEEIQVVVRLRGPVADPTLELSSEPVLPQDEILSRLLFGRSVARITPAQGLRLAAAVNTLRGGSALSDMLSSLRRGLGVDTLDFGGETAQESTARAGKYLTDNVFLEIERGVAAGSTKARVQVELTPNLSVNTEVDEQSRSGVGLEYRYDY